jgi:hypothetical protein
MTTTMTNTTKRLLCLVMGLLSTSVSAFAPFQATASATELSAFGRRQVLRGLKRVIVAGGATSAFQREAALAEEAPTTGRIVEFEMANLDGHGSSGTVRILTRPEWAPRGVARFEVSEMEYYHVILVPGYWI